jgi:hypothetical protein
LVWSVSQSQTRAFTRDALGLFYPTREYLIFHERCSFLLTQTNILSYFPPEISLVQSSGLMHSGPMDICQLCFLFQKKIFVSFVVPL